MFGFLKKKKGVPAEEKEQEQEDLKLRIRAGQDAGVVLQAMTYLNKTDDPRVFFKHYREAVTYAEDIVSLNNHTPLINGKSAAETLKNLAEEKTEMINALLNRCIAAGKMNLLQGERWRYEEDLTPESRAYWDEVVPPLPVPDPFPDGTYMYCTVQLSKDGKAYYFRAEDESLSPGDGVIVPIGDGGKKIGGRIVKVLRVPGESAPVPPESAKVILRRAKPRELSF